MSTPTWSFPRIPEGHERTGLGKHLFAEMRFNAGRQRAARLRAQSAGLAAGGDPGRLRELRLWLEPRARAVGAARFRHPLRDRAVLRRHLLQQLLQERHPAAGAAQGGLRPADRRCRTRRQRDAHDRPRGAGADATRRRAHRLRGRALTPQPAAGGARRDRRDGRQGAQDRCVRGEGQAKPALAGDDPRRPDHYLARNCTLPFACPTHS